MTNAPQPNAFASFRSFSYDPRGPWPDASGVPIDIAEEYHQASKVSAAFPSGALGPAGRLLATSSEAPFALGRKTLAHTGPRIPLPSAGALDVDLTEVTYRRQTWLPDACQPLTRAHLGTILGLCAGASPQRPGLRVVPSGGAMYPLDVFAIVHAVDGLDAGAYLYDPLEHGLLHRTAIDSAEFHKNANIADPSPQPALTLAVVATFARTRAKYGVRGYRFALIEAGHVVQAALTVATALGLAAQPWGGFVDAAVDGALELDGLERSCVYLLAISGPSDGEHP